MADNFHWSTLPRSGKALVGLSAVGVLTGMVECAFGIVTLLHDPNPSYAAAGLDPATGRAMEASMFFVVAAVQLVLAWLGWRSLHEHRLFKPLVITGGIIGAFCVLALLGELSQGGMGLEDAAFIVPIFTFACALDAKRHLQA